MLTPDKFANCFIAFESIDNCRQGAQRQRDQLSPARITNSYAKDGWTIFSCGPANGKVVILDDQNRRAKQLRRRALRLTFPQLAPQMHP
jgi:hypothetical protein